jgi:betaine lipid synthase
MVGIFLSSTYHAHSSSGSQGHLLELKLAAIQSLSYDDFFSMFGHGQHNNFRAMLDARISPYISSTAYQFWRVNQDAFSTSFYLRGYSGWALRLAQIVFSIAGVSADVEAICRADSVMEQEKIWQEKLRPVFLNPVVVALLKNPVFCWNALGVPMNQRDMLLKEGTAYEFVRDTLDPLPSSYLFKDGAYFYLLVSCLPFFLVWGSSGC